MTFDLKQRADILRSWYRNISVQYELIRFTKNREFVFLSPKWLAVDRMGFDKRYNRIHSIQHFQEILFNGARFDNINGVFNHEQLNDHVFNCYYSLAEYNNGIPYTSLRNDLNDSKIKSEWLKNAWRDIKSYDFLIDIDAHIGNKTLGWAKESMILITDLLDEYNIPYILLFTLNGFQARINLSMDKIDPVKYSYDRNAERNVYQFFTHALKLLHDNISEMVDYKTICIDETRLGKLPYSIGNNKNSVYVVWPFLTKEEFLNFNISDALISNVRDKIGHRGYKLFNIYPLCPKYKEENFINMVNYLESLNKPNKRRIENG